jgi:hypothetical protein
MRRKIYSEAEVRLIFLRSEGQPSPVTGQPGHSGAGHNTLSNLELDSRNLASGRNPTAFVGGLREQVEVATKLLNSPEGQTRLGELDAAGPGRRRTITAEVIPAVAIRYGMGQGIGMTRVLPAHALPSTRARMVVDSTADSIHIQSIHPLLPGQE